MTNDMLDFTFDDIQEIVADKDSQSLYNTELNMYEKVFLYKRQEIDDKILSDIAPLQEVSTAEFKKIEFNGSQRLYLEDLSERNFSLESTTPYKIEIGEHVIEEGSWGDLLCKVVQTLLIDCPDKRDGIYDFRVHWTKTAIFFKEKKTNSKCLSEELWLNCNHTALHSCWLLQEILDYFGCDKSNIKFLIHRPCSVEPKDVRIFVKERFVRGFLYYLITQRGRDSEQAQKVVKLIEKYLNPILISISKSYTDFFLFDSNVVLSSYVKKVRTNIESSLKYNDKEKKVLIKYLNYLYDYYRL